MSLNSILKPRTSATVKPGYLPTLDGWRAIAILGVIFTHDRLYAWGHMSTGWLHDHGGQGVNLFFAISGLLICSRLLEEERAFGRISLRSFYIRRAFRILPPAIGFLIVVGVLSLVGILRIGLRDWLGALLFFHNYTSLLGKIGPDSVFVNHFWSLAVEEHFYLILPPILVLTRRRWRIPVLLTLALLVEIHRWQVLRSRSWIEVGHHTDVLLDLLLIPASVAVLTQFPRFRDRFRTYLRIWPLILLFVVVLITYWSDSFWGITACALLMPLMLLGSILNPESLLARLLESGPLRYIGRISYSLYLWQQIFFISHIYTGVPPLGILESTPLRFAGLLVCSIVSYHLIERPLIKIGHRLAPPATPGREDIPAGNEDANSGVEALTPS